MTKDAKKKKGEHRVGDRNLPLVGSGKKNFHVAPKSILHKSVCGMRSFSSSCKTLSSLIEPSIPQRELGWDRTKFDSRTEPDRTGRENPKLCLMGSTGKQKST